MTIYNLVIKTLQVKADQGREIGCQQGVSEAETLIQSVSDRRERTVPSVLNGHSDLFYHYRSGKSLNAGLPAQ